MKIRSTFQTDTGRRRPHNEDTLLVDEPLGLYVVCDGMGGHASGEVASRMAADAFRAAVQSRLPAVRAVASGDRSLRDQALAAFRECASEANRAVFEHASSDPEHRGMGTTLTAMFVYGERALIAHVGDSRLYLVRGEQMHQVTTDHTILSEMVRAGRISYEEGSKRKQLNALTRAVGVYPNVEPEILDIDLLPNDTFVLCSDGLHNYFDDFDLLTFLAHTEPHMVAEELVAYANRKGGADNITVVCLQVRDGRETTQTQRLRLTLKTLREIPLFHYLSFAELLRVITVCEVREVPEGQDVVREGDPGDALYVLLEGSATVSKGGVEVARLRAGRHFGEMALIDNQPRSATVTAAADIAVIRIDRDAFYRVLREDSVMAVKLLWNFIQTLTGVIRNLQTDIVEANARMTGSFQNPFGGAAK
jgi:serine/threonine protein phosphatase PrpC